MKVLPHETLGDVVGRNFYSSEIFDSYNIDYCCEGGVSVKEACEARNVDLNIITSALEDLPNQEDEASAPFAGWPLDLLIDYIEKKHHRYINVNLPELYDLLERAIETDGSKYPVLKKAKDLLKQSEKDLVGHMQQEEQIVFPYIRNLVLAHLHPENLQGKLSSGSIENLAGNSIEDHQNQGEWLDEISELTNGYRAPGDAGRAYRLLLKKLDEFEKDLHRHIHLENNILFPRALELEQQH